MANSKEILDGMVEQVREAEEEVRALKKAANTMARRAGVDPPFPDVDAAATASRTGTQAIRPDQFVTYNAPAAAARAYLEFRGKERGAASIDDIYDALRRGGYSFEARSEAEAKGGLKVALAKDTNVHKIDNGAYGVSYGLLVWYPGLRERRDPAAEPQTGPRSRRPRRSGDEDPGAPPPPAAGDDDSEAPF